MMGKTQKRKAKRAALKKVYKCEVCNGVEPDKPVVACDQCDKWHHFACVGIESIGKDDPWKCEKCSSQDIIIPITSQQSKSEVVPQRFENLTLPLKDLRKDIDKTPVITTGHNYELRYDQRHPFHHLETRLHDPDQQSQTPISVSSRFTRISSRRQTVLLDLIKEERELQEQRDIQYLANKYQVLMGQQCSERHYSSSQISRTTRSEFTSEWVEKHSSVPTKVNIENKDLGDSFQSEDRGDFISRLNALTFETFPKTKTLESRNKVIDPIQSKLENRSSKQHINTTFIPEKQKHRVRSKEYNDNDDEEGIVACCLCTKRYHYVCMDTVNIDGESFWMCFPCGKPKIISSTTEQNVKKQHRSLTPVQPITDFSLNNKPVIQPKKEIKLTELKSENQSQRCEGCNKIDDKQPLLPCDVCEKLYHFACMNLSSIDKSVIWVCPKCKDPEFKPPPAPLQQNADDKEILAELMKMFEPNRTENVRNGQTHEQNQQQTTETKVREVMEPSPGARHTLTSAQIASRHVVTKDLPIFVGKPEQWPMFLSRFQNSTELCGFSNSENLDRLQKCLKGNALDAVRSRLLTAESVPEIIATLEMLYGRPELIVNSLMKRIRDEPPPKAEKLNTLIDFALSVRNVCATLEQANLTYHLSNPTLVQELVEKLPTNIKIEWAKHKTNMKNVNLSTFGDFLYDLAKVISTVTEPSAPKEHKSEKQNNKKDSERLNVHRENQSRKEPSMNVHTTVKNQENSSQSTVCKICQKTCEKVENCPQFRSHDVEQRWKDVYKHKLCRKCLKNHSRFCNSTKSCAVNGCLFKHHPMLHDEKKHSTENLHKSYGTTLKAANNVHSTFDRNVLLRIVPVIIYAEGRKIQTFAYLDDGSDITLVNERIAQFLGLQGSKQPLCLIWTGDIHRSEKKSQMIEIYISGQGESSQRYLLQGVRTVETLGLPTQSLIHDELVRKFPYMRDVPIEDYLDAIPEILIGSDNASLNTQLRIVEGDMNQPIASECRLGWSINGRIDNKYPTISATVNPHRNLCVHNSRADEDLHQQVKEYFTLENFGVQVKNDLNLCSKEDERALELLKKFTKRINGRYETSLLWRYDKFEIPETYTMAKKRLLCLEKHKPQMIKSINETIIDYLNKGYVSKLNSTEIDKIDCRICYLPIFAVTYPKKPDKIRTVFDAAAKVNGVSLNDLLLKGPDQLASLLNILRRFREKRIAITGDIKEMFHQVKIRDEDKQAQRFLWRNEVTGEIDEYVMNVMTFGATCSPSAAQFVKNLNASEFEKSYPRATESIVKNHYVDDMLDCEHSEKKMIQLVKDVKKIHAHAGFEIRNFKSNSIKVMRAIGVDTADYTKSLNLDTSLGTERVLGMWWNQMSDCFTFSLKYTNIKEDILKGKKMPTKREILKTLMSVFDPLGLISHFLVHLKILLQDVWRGGMDWDQEITSEDMKTSWRKWIEILTQVEELQIPRLYTTNMSPNVSNSIELHTFVDASAQAFSAVTYIRVESNEGVQCALIGSKTRVAPLKYLSIPRLELQGEQFGLTLKLYLVGYVPIIENINSLSHIELVWKVFVAHRILENTNKNEWRWIPTKENVADEATKWNKNISFQSRSRWYTGPEFLKFSEENWPTNRMDIQEDTTEEMKVHYIHAELIVPTLINSENFSNWNKMVRVMAYARRYVLILRSKIYKDVVVRGTLNRDELVHARNLIFRQAQFESFPEEMVILRRNQSQPNNRRQEISKRSSIFNCSPYLDENGILRIRGRIDLAPYVSKDTKRPIILPKDNRITRLLVLCYHKMYHHRNHGTVINEMCQKFHIASLRDVLKSVRFNECQLCKVRNARPATPEMGSLPAARLAIGFRAFTYIGIDYFGPMMVTVGRRTEKRWGVLITCLTIRAIHIEIAHTLDTDSCIMCIDNFTKIYGPVREIYSDQGTNFKGMDNELKRLIAQIDINKMATEFTSFYTKWCFNPPVSAWMGGSWERMVRSVKTSLYEILPARNPTDEMLRNLLMEVQHVVNSRPLTFISLDHEEDEALTPNHFLFGSSNSMKPVVPLETDGPILRSKWKENQRLTNLFWQRFIKEYLPTLTRRTKWFNKTEPIKVGDIVLIIEETNIRNTYPKARVLETVLGSNQQVGKVRIQLGDPKRTILWRPAQVLAKLDIHKSEGLAIDPVTSKTGGSVMNASFDLSGGTEKTD